MDISTNNAETTMAMSQLAHCISLQVCLLTNPVWLIKTRLALQQRGATAAGVRPYKGLVDAFVRIGREEGFRGYYKGLGPSLILVSMQWK